MVDKHKKTKNAGSPKNMNQPTFLRKHQVLYMIQVGKKIVYSFVFNKLVHINLVYLFMDTCKKLRNPRNSL